MTGSIEGKLYVHRQVEDYALRGVEFETMGFLTFTVETYERRLKNEEGYVEADNDGNESIQENHEDRQYLLGHPKHATHIRVSRSENHNSLPNIVGPWFPRRDGEETTKAFYYASMLALLKPWRDLRNLKKEDQNWDDEFDTFMLKGTQRDRDVIAGSQYYYETKNVGANRAFEERDGDVEESEEGNDEMGRDEDEHVESVNTSVS